MITKSKKGRSNGNMNCRHKNYDDPIVRLKQRNDSIKTSSNNFKQRKNIKKDNIFTYIVIAIVLCLLLLPIVK